MLTLAKEFLKNCANYDLRDNPNNAIKSHYKAELSTKRSIKDFHDTFKIISEQIINQEVDPLIISNAFRLIEKRISLSKERTIMELPPLDSELRSYLGVVSEGVLEQHQKSEIISRFSWAGSEQLDNFMKLGGKISLVDKTPKVFYPSQKFVIVGKRNLQNYLLIHTLKEQGVCENNIVFISALGKSAYHYNCEIDMNSHLINLFRETFKQNPFPTILQQNFEGNPTESVEHGYTIRLIKYIEPVNYSKLAPKIPDLNCDNYHELISKTPEYKKVANYSKLVNNLYRQTFSQDTPTTVFIHVNYDTKNRLDQLLELIISANNGQSFDHLTVCLVKPFGDIDRTMQILTNDFESDQKKMDTLKSNAEIIAEYVQVNFSRSIASATSRIV